MTDETCEGTLVVSANGQAVKRLILGDESPGAIVEHDSPSDPPAMMALTEATDYLYRLDAGHGAEVMPIKLRSSTSGQDPRMTACEQVTEESSQSRFSADGRYCIDDLQREIIIAALDPSYEGPKFTAAELGVQGRGQVFLIGE